MEVTGNIGEVALFGVSMVVIIPLLVEGFKRLLHMPAEWAPWANLILCFLAAIASAVLELFPEMQNGASVVIYTVVSALVLWLLTTGLYTAGKNILGSKSSSDGTGTETDTETDNK